jgi:hypothetical protein
MLCILAVGVVLCAAGFAKGGVQPLVFNWNGFKLERVEDAGEMVKVDEDFSGEKVKNVVIDLDVMDHVLVTEGDAFTVKGQNLKSYGGLEAKLDGKTLIVTESVKGWSVDSLLTLGWQDNTECAVTITVPKGFEVNSLEADVNVADLRVEKIAADEARFTSDVGGIEVADVTAKDLTLDAATGDAALTGVEAKNAEIKTNVGSFRADGLHVRKNLLYEGNIGDSVFTGLVLDKKAEFQVNTGNLELGFAMGEDDVEYEIDSDLGDVAVDGRQVDKDYAHSARGATAKVAISSNIGNVTLSFEN